MSRFPHTLLLRLGFAKRESRTYARLPEGNNGAATFLPAPFSLLLRNYFRSGWAFFIPYLAAYLLYAWLMWPVNPGATEGRSMEQGARVWVPCLLHVYWALHVIHIILAGIALWSWWRLKKEGSNVLQEGAENTENVMPYSAPLPSLSPVQTKLQSFSHSSVLRPPSSVLWPLAPWLLLALVFYIPGVYLEWPSDPWEHSRRIQYWATQATIRDPLGRYKDLYFFNYSIATLMSSSMSLTAVTNLAELLLAWQFYRLARAAKLNARLALIFVMLNCVTFGNSTFSFFRYYGLSTSLFCQIGVVAFMRLLITRFDRRYRFSCPELGTGILKAALVVLALLFLIARSHIQGLAMCAMALAAMVAWRLVGREGRWGRLLLLVVVINFAVLALWPRHPAVNSTLLSDGWFSPLLGFNPLPGSAAGGRFLAILGLFGLLDLVAGAYLVCRNHPVGWLTVAPLLGLLQPAMAVPLANFILANGEILIFHRLLLATPIGLASVVAGLALAPALSRLHLPIGFASLTTLLFAFAVISPGQPCHNRLWNLLCVVPADQGLESEQKRLAEILPGARAPDARMLVAATPLAFLVDSAIPGKFPARDRRDPLPPSGVLLQRQAQVASYGPTYGADPAPVSDWIALGGDRPEAVTASLVSGEPAVAAAQNPAGHRAEAFGRDPIDVDPMGKYWLEMTVRSLAPVPGRTLLAVVWYDTDRRPMPSFAAPPEGAGAPAGWSNGTYSYFGLIDEPAPSAPTTYRIALGPEGAAQIPATARYIRVGGLLNQDESASAKVELSNVRFWPRRAGDLLVPGTFASHSRVIYAHTPPTAFSPGSLVARLSGHWNPYQLSLDLAGAPEIDATFRGSVLHSWVSGVIEVGIGPGQN